MGVIALALVGEREHVADNFHIRPG